MKILAYIPPPQKASPARIYRGEGMLERLNGLNGRYGEPVTIDYVTPEMFSYDWAQLMKLAKSYDWLFLMRPAQSHEVQFAARLQSFGLKLWYDLDDDYSAVQPDNAAYHTFQRQDVKESWNFFLQNSDLVTYSTEGLVKKFGKGHWVPNALDDKYFDIHKNYPAPKKGLITWRGGGSHFQDLQDFTPVLGPLINEPAEAKPWIWHFIGFYPWWLGNVRYTNYIHDYWYFMSMLEDLKPWGHIVPLTDNGFNRSKSCISAMEAIYAGAIPVIPNFDEWKIPGALVYNSHAEFEHNCKILKLMDFEEHEERWVTAMDWIIKNRSLSDVNRKRIEILEGFSE